jgi:hypothetical protein
MAEQAFHGIHTSRQMTASVTHVSGTRCHLCLGSHTAFVRREELPKQFRRQLGSRFRKEVTAFHRLSIGVIAPCPPKRERTSIFGVPDVHCTLASPKDKSGACDTAVRAAIRFIVRAIDRSSGAVFLAYGMRVRRISECLSVSVPSLWAESWRRRTPAAQCVVDEGFGRCCQ